VNARQRRTGRRLARTVCAGWNGAPAELAFERACRKHKVDIDHLRDQWHWWGNVSVEIYGIFVDKACLLGAGQVVWSDDLPLRQAVYVSAGAILEMRFQIVRTPVTLSFVMAFDGNDTAGNDRRYVASGGESYIGSLCWSYPAPEDFVLRGIRYATTPKEPITVALWLDRENPIARRRR
jgi:hypothetical protein